MNKEELIKYLDEELARLSWVNTLPYNSVTTKGWTRILQKKEDFKELKKLITDVTI